MWHRRHEGDLEPRASSDAGEGNDPNADVGGDGDGDGDEVLEVQLDCEQFTVDLIKARLASEGVEVLQSSMATMTAMRGPLSRGSTGFGTTSPIAFRRSDLAAVEVALRDAGLL